MITGVIVLGSSRAVPTGHSDVAFLRIGVNVMQARLEALAKHNIELIAVKERLALALEVADLAVWDWDIPTGIIQFQPKIGGILGYSDISEPSYQQCRDITHPDDLPACDAAFQAHVRGDTPRYGVECRMRNREGDWRWMDCRGEIILRAPDTSPLRAVGTLSDITGKKEEAANRDFLSDLKNKLAPANKPEVILAITLEALAHHLMAARVGISELRRDRTGFLTRAVWSQQARPLPPPEDRTVYSAALIEEMCANRPFVVENVQTDPRCSGTGMAQIYEDMGVQSLLNIPMLADGAAPVFLYVHHESPRKWHTHEVQLCQQVAEQFWSILSRASAESVRDKAEEMLNLALSIAQLGAMDHDYKSGVQRMSDGFLKLIGHPELASKSRLGFLDIEYLNIVHPDDQDRFAAKVADSISKGEDFELDDKHRIITAAGETRRIHYKSRSHFEAGEDGIKMLSRSTAIIIDTTESTLQAEASAQTQERLHKMSRLTAMGTMASTLAHELNQPLTAAANYLNVLRALDQKDSSLDGYSRADVLNLAANSVLDAGKIIKKMRNFTSGGNLQRAPVSLAAIADNAVRHANGKVARGTLEIIINVPKRLMIDVDAMQIEQILANLLRNAAEAMTHQHNGKITLSAREHDGFVDLHVTDNGPGIPDDFAAGLFNPFQSSKSEGLGLGLSLCRTMVEAHGGHLKLIKHDSTGCDFLIRLPKAARRRRAV